VWAPVHEVGCVAPEPQTGPPDHPRPPQGSLCSGARAGGRYAQIFIRAYQHPTRNPSRMPHRNVAAPTGGCYLLILMTWPAPTVRPPSRMANCRPSSMAMGWISFTLMVVLSPGMTISVPLGSVTTPVTSVVRK
jgi:hypothetical protein